MEALIAWLLAHSALLAAVVVAVIDFLWSLSPGLKDNGILDWLYNTAKGLLGKSS
jgi:hypothetical protein